MISHNIPKHIIWKKTWRSYSKAMHPPGFHRLQDGPTARCCAAAAATRWARPGTGTAAQGAGGWGAPRDSRVVQRLRDGRRRRRCKCNLLKDSSMVCLYLLHMMIYGCRWFDIMRHGDIWWYMVKYDDNDIWWDMMTMTYDYIEWANALVPPTPFPERGGI